MLKTKKLVALFGVWYFLTQVPGSASSITQVGPFATQAACQNFASAALQNTWQTNNLFDQNGSPLPSPTAPLLNVSACFSTTAKQ